LRKLPLIERKQHLHALIKKSRLAEIIYAQHIETQGEALFEEICHRDLEGVVAKRGEQNTSARASRTVVLSPHKLFPSPETENLFAVCVFRELQGVNDFVELEQESA
jgi:hypothetical protein